MSACVVPNVQWAPYSENNASTEVKNVTWPVTLCCDVTDVTPDVVNNAIAGAIDVLFTKTGKRFGTCDAVIRPCGVCDCGSSCTGCCEVRALDIGDFFRLPVASISRVEVNGAALVEGVDYFFSGGRLLVPVRNGALWKWPHQDLNKPLGDKGTWGVHVAVGSDPPPILLTAVADLACQIISYCQNKPCDLPPNAVSVTRDGVTVKLDTGLRAIPTVRIALETYAIDKTSRPSRIFDPRSESYHTNVW